MPLPGFDVIYPTHDGQSAHTPSHFLLQSFLQYRLVFAYVKLRFVMTAFQLTAHVHSVRQWGKATETCWRPIIWTSITWGIKYVIIHWLELTVVSSYALKMSAGQWNFTSLFFMPWNYGHQNKLSLWCNRFVEVAVSFFFPLPFSLAQSLTFSLPGHLWKGADSLWWP